ncbi:hypothetical protein [Empedobacter sp. 189-2]|uniref:hypothetical protein n=1 Tax=Empedobacter sp. 189-2 TaxID=2746724 RepID=UPI0025760233|nr:hypothetical protein [Empedobacter sp. 189-2]MDM1542369.1 hypothetical protein [Empedobacter sp. 189-2]
MKKLYSLSFLLLLFASCGDNSVKEKDKLLIELNETKQQAVRLQNKLKQLQDELENCRLNYSATDEVSPTSTTSQ